MRRSPSCPTRWAMSTTGCLCGDQRRSRRTPGGSPYHMPSMPAEQLNTMCPVASAQCNLHTAGMALTTVAVQAEVVHHIPHSGACLPSLLDPACRVSVISGGQLAPQQSRSQVLPQHSQQQAHPQTRAGLAHPSQGPQGPPPPTLPARGQAPQPAPGQAQRPLPPPPSQLQRQSSSAQHGGVAQGQQQQHRGSLEQSLSQVNGALW